MNKYQNSEHLSYLKFTEKDPLKNHPLYNTHIMVLILIGQPFSYNQELQIYEVSLQDLTIMFFSRVCFSFSVFKNSTCSIAIFL